VVLVVFVLAVRPALSDLGLILRLLPAALHLAGVKPWMLEMPLAVMASC
jgi:hypothetical protein